MNYLISHQKLSRLRAAASDMLEALKAAEEHEEHIVCCALCLQGEDCRKAKWLWTRAVRLRNKALAKARGEDQ